MSRTSDAYLTVTPHDPVIARDGRPFGNGLRMRVLDWLYPSVLAGALRTLLGEQSGGFPQAKTAAYQAVISRLKQIAVRGPLPCADYGRGASELCLPAPLDVVVRRSPHGGLEAFSVRPWSPAAGSGCDFLRRHRLLPANLPPDSDDEFKPDPVPPFWALSRLVAWLLNARGECLLQPGATSWPDGYFRGAGKDRRTHVKLNPESGLAGEGMLFTTAGLDMTRWVGFSAEPATWMMAPEVSLAAHASTQDADFGALVAGLADWAPIGGERRIAHWVSRSRHDGAALWSVPSEIREALGQQPRYVRMILATPALFDCGWRPGWLLGDAKGQLVGQVPGTKLTVRLVSSCVGRWQPISGWSYEQDPPGPKPVRRLAPAGSVYFFRVEAGDSSALAERWLHSVSDQAQDALDGFGLAIWGLWEPFQDERTFSVSLS